MESFKKHCRALAVKRHPRGVDPAAIEALLLECKALVQPLKRDRVPDGSSHLDGGKRRLAVSVGRFSALAQLYQEALMEGGWGILPERLEEKVEQDRLEEAQELIERCLARCEGPLFRLHIETGRVAQELESPAGLVRFLNSNGYQVQEFEGGKHMLISTGFHLLDFWPEEQAFQLRHNKDRTKRVKKRVGSGSVFDVVEYLRKLAN